MENTHSRLQRGRDAALKNFNNHNDAPSQQTVDGRIVKPVIAAPHTKLLSNVHGMSIGSNSNAGRDPPRAGSRPSDWGNFARGSGVPPFEDQQSVTSIGYDTTRQRPAPLSTAPGQASGSQFAKPHTTPAPTVNSGPDAKSAKVDSKHECQFCSRGFTSAEDRKRHIDKEHEHCKVCKEDFDDDDAFVKHKVESIRHICCEVCGTDFRTEAGLERHRQQSHAAQQNVKCIGCGIVFARGAGLIKHIYENECNDTTQTIGKIVNRDYMEVQRAKAALLLHNLSLEGAMVHENASQSAPSVTGESLSGGGVPIPSSYLDEDPGDIQAAGPGLMDSNLMDDDISTIGGAPSTVSAGSGYPAQMINQSWPSVFVDKRKEKQREDSDSHMIQGLDALHSEPSRDTASDHAKPKTTPGAWSKTLFPDAKSTPTTEEWVKGAAGRPEENLGGRRSMLAQSENGSERSTRGWDAFNFQRAPEDGKYHCPFKMCDSAHVNLDTLKLHLTSGYHQGTDHRCIKCLKVFKSLAALTAHMESPSTRCNIRNTQGFGHVLNCVSGAFLGVSGRHADGTIKIEATKHEQIENMEAYMRGDPEYMANH